MKKSPQDRPEERGHPVLCAYCHEKIEGTPIEKNGYLYHEGHAELDSKPPPKT